MRQLWPTSVQGAPIMTDCPLLLPLIALVAALGGLVTALALVA